MLAAHWSDFAAATFLPPQSPQVDSSPQALQHIVHCSGLFFAPLDTGVGAYMSNRNQPDGGLLDLRLCAQTLAKQLEELQQLRDRVHRAEAKAAGAWRCQPSRRRRQTDCGPRAAR